MRSSHRTPPEGGAFTRRFFSYSGLFFDEFDLNSAWIRERGVVHLPLSPETGSLVIRGEIRRHPDARGIEQLPPRLRVLANGRLVGEHVPATPGPWEIRFAA